MKRRTGQATSPSGTAARSDAPSVIAESLREVDWDFPERIAHSAIEGIHPYPAKFVTELPRALLDAIPVPSQTAVLDPFCGSGTTLVECQRRGISSVGIDLNPIACLISLVKTAPEPPALEDAASSAVDRARNASRVQIPDIPRLDHWFNPDVQYALASLSNSISGTPVPHQDALRLALSSIIVRVSNQESDTRYAAIHKGTKANDVYDGFLRAAARLSNALHQRNYPNRPTDIIEGDTLAIKPSQIHRPIGMVITSPPYPNAYEYWLYHKYRMYWLGHDPLSVKDREIGARAHFFRRNHHTADDFSDQMTGTFRLVHDVLVPGGYACFVIGRSRIHGRIVDNAAIVKSVAKSFGFDLVYSAERLLSPTRKSFNGYHANIKTETVLVLRH